MVGSEPDDNADDCKFPNVRKNFWRSATWNAGTASTKLPFEGEEGADFSTERNPPQTLCSREQSSSVRARPSLQPLSMARRSFDSWPSTGMDDSPDLTSPITPGRRRVKAGLDIKLDLASVHRSIVEPTEIQLRRDKFALYDKQCSRVAKYHVYLGSDAVARDRDILRANEITHVLNCVGFVCPEYFKGDLEYKTLWLQDSPCEDLLSLLYDVFDYFEEVREQGGRVFVHCCQGVSRSTSLVIAYVMWREHKSFEEAFQDVKAARGVANPNMGFACQLLQCQKRMHTAPMSPKSVLRMYRVAPHSPYDPLHLVLKACANPGVELLDSRGAFVIHIPCAIILWIGQNCDPKMVQEAKEAVGQVIRYERAEVPVKIYTEGNEGIDFWDSFSDYSQSFDKEQVGNCNYTPPDSTTHRAGNDCKISRSRMERDRQAGLGSRKVASNDADYCVYQLARQGGIIPPFPFRIGGVGSMPMRVPVREDGWSKLRQKVSSRQLLASKCRPSSEGLNSNVLSPNISMGSSSPHFSPFSISSASSSTPAGSDTSFDSPLSSMSTLSPGTPEVDSAVLDGCSSPFVSSLQFASPLKTTAGLGRGSVLASSLAERRGSLPPPLQLPALEDMPPPAPRGASRKPRLPPLVMIEDHTARSTKKDCKDKNLMLVEKLVSAENFLGAQPISSLMQSSDMVASENSCEQMKSGAVSSCGHLPFRGIPENGCSFLYLWPDLEKINMFDADDLDTRGVFILVKSGCSSTENKQRVSVYIWVGRQLAANKEIQDSPGGKDTVWHQVGQDFASRMQLPTGVSINVVREGHEPEEFWDAFNCG